MTIRRKTLIGSSLAIAPALALIFFMRGPQAATIPWERDYEAALQKVQSKQLPLLVYLFADWCGYCRKMDAETFANHEFIRSVGPQYVWLRLNAETDEDGISLRKRFGVVGFPEITVLEADGEPLGRIEGFIPPDELGRRLDSLTKGPQSLPELRARAQKQPNSAPAQYDLAFGYFHQKDYERAVHRFSQVIDSDPDNLQGKTELSHLYLATSLASQNKLAEALAQLDLLEQKFPGSPQLPDAAILRAQIHYHQGDPRQARETLTTYLQKYPTHHMAARVRHMLAQLGPGWPLSRAH